MKIRIPAPTAKNAAAAQLVPVILKPHNLRFSHVKGNCLFFSVLRYPQKEIMEQVRKSENLEFSITGTTIRAAIKTTVTELCFIVQYQTRENHGKNRYTITEKEKVFTMSSGDREKDKAEIIQIVKPYLSRLYDSNSRRTAEILVTSFQQWEEPHPLETFAAILTEEQKRLAAAMLKVYFAA